MRAWSGCLWGACVVLGSGIAATADGPRGTEAGRKALAEGKGLFTRDWLPDDPRAHGGDGLGPAFNERSCVACHFQGGTGGAGPNSKNVDILTMTRPGDLKDEDRAALSRIDPGFRDATSVVFHRFGTDPGYEPWRRLWEDLLNHSSASFRGITLGWSQRNAPALFGAGRIDAIPEEVVTAGPARKPPGSHKVSGRPARLPDGRIGRFGWKAQVASLEDFVLTACAGEMGLEVPGHHQAASPFDAESRPPGLDMTGDECDSLVGYVRRLPAPVRRGPADAASAREVEEGRSAFIKVGCAACHSPTLGGVSGIYSDLLLHDMGQALSDSGAYYGGSPTDAGLARAQEWRTPPLWGVGDSAPFLHDGRAGTFEEAIAMHGGEGKDSATRYKKLPPDRRDSLVAFLNSLAAPDPTAPPLGPSRRRTR